MRFRELCNHTFVKNAISFFVVLFVSFVVLVTAEYVRAKKVTNDGYMESYSGCVTSSGEPC